MAADSFSPYVARFSPGISGPEIRVRINSGSSGAEIERILDAYYGNTDWRTGGGGSTLTGPQIVALIDATLGNADWQVEKFVQFGPTLPDPTTYVALSGVSAYTKTDDADGPSIGNWVTNSTSWVLPGGTATGTSVATDNFVRFGPTLPDPRTYTATSGVASFDKIDDADTVSLGSWITDGSSWILPGGIAVSTPAAATDNFVRFGANLPDPRTYIGTAGVATFTKTNDLDGVAFGSGWTTDGTSWVLP